MYQVYNIFTDKVIGTCEFYDQAYDIAQERNATLNEYTYDFKLV